MKILPFALWVAVLLVMAGCNTYKIALNDPVWNDNVPYAVEGRMQTVLQKKPLRFAEFHTTLVKTSWRKTTRQYEDIGGFVTGYYNNIAAVIYEQSNSSRRFILANNKGQEAKVLTFHKVRASNYLLGNQVELNLDYLLRTLGLDRRQTENSYYVQVFEPGSERPWELVLDNDAIELNPKNYAGYFALDQDHYYTIRPVNKLIGKNGPSSFPVGHVGYEVCNASGHAVAAVSLLGKTSVYLADDMEPDERFLMADLCAALLLHEPGSDFDRGINN